MLPPREAFFARHESVPIDAGGRAGRAPSSSRRTRPGVPVLAPGEEITARAVDLLRAARARGTRIAYAADPGLRTLTVVAR